MERHVFRFIENGYMDELFTKLNDSKEIYFIKRTDTNKYFYIEYSFESSNHPDFQALIMKWSDILPPLFLSGAFLIKEEAKKFLTEFKGNYCKHCKRGDKPIPVEVISYIKSKEVCTRMQTERNELCRTCYLKNECTFEIKEKS